MSATEQGKESEKRVVLSGIRATGILHLGNWFGAIQQFVQLQNDPLNQCFYFVADLHTLTTMPDPNQIRTHLPNIVLDYLAAGLDPNRSIIYTQSSVTETVELMWLLANLMPVGDLERAPSFKEKAAKQPDNVNAGLLNYPVLMAADILGPKADLVPVGEDQLVHLEMTRELVRKFNRLFGEVFPEPKALHEKAVRVPGLDGSGKMGKSDNNSLSLTESPDEMWAKLKVAVTDPARKTRQDPGNPLICNIYSLHRFVSSRDELEWAYKGCTTAGIGCLDCKAVLHKNTVELLKPFQERRLELLKEKEIVREVLSEGGKRARAVIAETVAQVRDLMGIVKY